MGEESGRGEWEGCVDEKRVKGESGRLHKTSEWVYGIGTH